MPARVPSVGCCRIGMARLKAIYLVKAMEWMFATHSHNESLQIILSFACLGSKSCRELML